MPLYGTCSRTLLLHAKRIASSEINDTVTTGTD